MSSRKSYLFLCPWFANEKIMSLLWGVWCCCVGIITLSGGQAVTCRQRYTDRQTQAQLLYLQILGSPLCWPIRPTLYSMYTRYDQEYKLVWLRTPKPGALCWLQTPNSWDLSWIRTLQPGALAWTRTPQPGALKVHKIEIFFGFDFEICIISLLVMSKY
jgi:hypothetical protein